MSVPAEAMTHYREVLGRAAGGHGPAWLAREREAAAQRFEASGFPTRKDEAWRYSGVDALLKRSFVPMEGPAAEPGDLQAGTLFLDGLDSHRLVFLDGRYVPVLSRIDGLPDGVEAGSLAAALAADPERLRHWWGQAGAGHGHVFAALNTALFADGLWLHVPADVSIDRPLELVFVSSGVEELDAVAPRNLIVVESGANVSLVERYVGADDVSYFNNTLSEILLGRDACLDHYRLQEEGARAFHISSLFTRLDEGSRYQGLNLALGGAWSRADLNLEFAGPGASSDCDGLYVAGDRQVVDFHLNVEHGVPDCASQQDFKGLLLGRGKAVFDGRIHVAKDAQGTDAHLANANLLLSREAEVDTKPQLEIFADDVKCSHGTTVGQLDPAMIFYLRSRGIPEIEARRMLCLGFADALLERCPVVPLREHAEAVIGTRLERVTAMDASDE
jgi:Fe-S cluster assembly protein SufD